MSVEIGAPRPPAWLAAVFEGAGATLWWHAETGAAGAEIWDAPRAAGWLGAVWPAVLSEETGGAFGFSRTSEAKPPASAVPGSNLRQNPTDSSDTSDRTGPLESYARAVAFVGWRAAWWPASHTGVAPLDPRVLEAERMIALAALDGASDDDDAVGRAALDFAARVREIGTLDATALDAHDAARLARLLPQDRRQSSAQILDSVREIADDHGISVPRVPIVRRADYALAASGTPLSPALISGSAPIDPGSVPQHVVDPFGRIEWRVTVAMTIEVTVPGAPMFQNARPPEVDLHADIAGIDVPLERNGDLWFGTATASAGLIALPPDRRTAALRAAGFAPVEGVDPDTLRRIADGL